MDERKAFEAWAKPRGYRVATWHDSGYFDDTTNEVWMAWQAATAAERERCATLSPNGLNVLASDSPAVVWQKYSAGIRKD